MVIRWSSNARKRIKEIYLFYKERSERVAVEMLADFNSVAEHLATYPQMAAREPLLADFAKVYRSLLVRKHFRIIYFVNKETDEIVIVTVWDSRQDPEKLKREVDINPFN
jgi:plasmid stabilization system protein ParE